MKRSQFKELIKEMFIDLINNDDEMRDIVLEFVKENSNVLVESLSPQEQVKKEPADPELYDKLMLIASGQQKRMNYNGKTVQTPNYGVGFKSGKMIQEWANKQYSNVGGEWISGQRAANPESIAALASMFVGADSAQGAEIAGVARTGNSAAIRDTIRSKMSTEILDENFQPAGDITDLLVDTAQTTLQHFPSTHEGGNGAGAGAGREAFAGTPEQAFGSQVAGNWATLAFSGMDSGE